MVHIDIEKAVQHLRVYWGYDQLRIKQVTALNALNQHQHILVLMPTGGGKSLCYQLPALQLNGLTIVVSPLIALMDDQVKRLRDNGIKAVAIHSGQSHHDIDRIISNLKFDDTKLVYVSPERLQSSRFITLISAHEISMMVVDEAHCISQWGHDFRPAYKTIHSFIEVVKPNVVLGLTGTANASTIQEICEELKINQEGVIRDSFLRKNITIDVRHSEDKLKDLIRIIGEGRSKSIIYSRSRRNVEMISSYLNDHHINASYYHAGISYKLKKSIQNQFLQGKVKVIVATNAFGMGVDIADISKVIHYDIPPSLEEYYQEIGRAGRNGALSEAVMLYSEMDRQNLHLRFTEEFPDIDQLYSAYRRIHLYYNHDLNQGEGKKYPLDILKMSKSLNHRVRHLNLVLKALSLLGCMSTDLNPKEQWYIKYLQDVRALRGMTLSGPLDELKLLLLRKYITTKGEWIKVDIVSMAQKLNTSIESIKGRIIELSKQSIIQSYTLPEGPILFFNEGRLNKIDFRYKSGKYNKLKRIKERRVLAMQEYINIDSCYNRLLLSYLDEELDRPCGICQNCHVRPLEVTDDNTIINMDTDQLKTAIINAMEQKNAVFLRKVQSLASPTACFSCA